MGHRRMPACPSVRDPEIDKLRRRELVFSRIKSHFSPCNEQMIPGVILQHHVNSLSWLYIHSWHLRTSIGLLNISAFYKQGNKAQRWPLGHLAIWWLRGWPARGGILAHLLPSSWPTEVSWWENPQRPETVNALSFGPMNLPEANWEKKVENRAEGQGAPLYIWVNTFFHFPFIVQAPWIIYLLLNSTEWDFKGNENWSSNETKLLLWALGGPHSPVLWRTPEAVHRVWDVTGHGGSLISIQSSRGESNPSPALLGPMQGRDRKNPGKGSQPPRSFKKKCLKLTNNNCIHSRHPLWCFNIHTHIWNDYIKLVNVSITSQTYLCVCVVQIFKIYSLSNFWNIHYIIKYSHHVVQLI